MSNLAEVIRDRVRNAVAEDELELPTLPEVALRIRDEGQKESVSAASLCEVIAQDPGLAAFLVKAANSPMFRGANSIDDLQTAIGRLGVVYAANLATGLAIKQMFHATSEFIDRKLRSVWAHACEVAAISGVIANSFTELPPDQATLAGLTHSIGTLPVLMFAEENEALIKDRVTLDKAIDSVHGSLGTMILHNWDFPAELVMVPAGYSTFDRTTEQPDLVDVVMVANLQTMIGTEHPFAKLDWSRIGAFTRLGLDPNPQSQDLDAFYEDVAAAKDLMGA